MYYSIEDGRVCRMGSGILNEADMFRFMSYALTRRHRKREVPKTLLTQLQQTGSIRVPFRHGLPIDGLDDLTFDLEIDAVEGGYRVTCVGDLAWWALLRVNEHLGYRPPRRARERLYRKKSAKRKKAAVQSGPAPVQARKPRKAHFTPAPMALPWNITERSVVKQFKHLETTWSRMLDAVPYVFKLKGDGIRTARQLAAKELWRSYGASGGKFAQFRRMGFTLRFDLIDGIWRGDLTRLTISATKLNKSIYYRRMRLFFGDRFLEPVSKRQMRRRRTANAKWRMLYPGRAA